MPIYEYECIKHGKFEEYQSITAGKSLNCPECGMGCKRVFSAPAKAIFDFRPGWDEGAGRHFGSSKERNNWLTESGSERIRS